MKCHLGPDTTSSVISEAVSLQVGHTDSAQTCLRPVRGLGSEQKTSRRPCTPSPGLCALLKAARKQLGVANVRAVTQAGISPLLAYPSITSFCGKMPFILVWAPKQAQNF